MYLVYKNHRKTNHAFPTYDQARAWVRKQIRKLYPAWNELDNYFSAKGKATNPLSIKDYGYTIKSVN